ncbi:MAG: glycoside hydrolase family 31 protein [Algoriphagus sp.]|uniref:glycoside hydrolase family 31 protein n=1 Tax=Algoriphagus sp. TaxID=1872435 RepID=UPI00179DC1E9|nr:glycoside hydrolase family 31 protein [Algoriphagus sp.]NVJ87084.1 glycoside hydrolase family 31 protein [Algoriphagus sp.]
MQSKPLTINRASSSRHQGLGSILSWKEDIFGIAGETTNGFFKLTFYNESIIRFQASKFEAFDQNPYSVIIKPETSTFKVQETDQFLILESSMIHVSIQKSTTAITFRDLKGNILNEDDSLGVAWIGTEVNCYKKVQKDEHFLGLGEKTGGLDRKGKAFTNWNTDYFGYGVEDDPLYMSIPFYMGVHEGGNYGIFFDNTYKSVFNFGASTNRFMYFGAEDGDMDYYFIHRPTLSEIISEYTFLTGRMQLPPKWSLGFQQCRYSYYPDSEVKTLAQTFRDKDMPADVIYLDIHHMEAYKVFTFDGEKFPDPKSLIKELKKKGFRVVVIMDPGIKAEENYLPYVEGKEKGLFVSYPDGEEYQGQVWPGWCAFPDFTKEETRTWWGEKMKFYQEAGVDGYWTDMNEPASWGQFTPNLIEFNYEGETSSHRKARNIYGMQMARSAQEGAIKQQKKERPFVLTRSGFSGIQRYAAAWTGDNVASEEHMLAGVRLVNSLGMSGVPFSGFDVGGFAGEACKSLFARWMSIGVFTPLFRAHSMINSNDAEPWAFGEEVEEISRNYMKFRYGILPTIYSKFYKSSQDGLPISQSLAIHYPLDSKIYNSAYQNQFLFCDAFLVAPVESTKEITKVYLPEGSWFYLYNDEFHSGSKELYLDCPLNYLPVLVKAGSIFTMQSPVSYTDEKHDGVLKVHVYRGEKGSSFTHYEDDGITFNYKKEEFFQRMITYDPQKMTLTFEEGFGNYTSAFPELEIFFHGFQFDAVTVNGKSLEVTKHDFAFLGKLTEFDPLPEHDHPYYEIKQLRSLKIKHDKKEIEISGLI